MALNEQEEAKVRELLTAFENGKRINELEPTDGLTGSTLIEVMDESGETRKMELETAVAEAGNPIAGRWWDSTLATTKAGGWFGSLEALRKLPETLGLGRYLVTDDRQMRKLDPLDSRRFEDGSPAALDGSMGQCMWCWSREWYFTRWSDGNRDKWAITLKPIPGKKSYRIPAGGTSWLGVGVMDRNTDMLCSVISEDGRYIGGQRSAINPSGKTKHPDSESPQMSMLGMAATNLSCNDFGYYARKRGEGWEANWFVAQAAVEILICIIMGERNLNTNFNSEKDSDGLYQGGFGNGSALILPGDWASYNGYYPLVPTSVGFDVGDFTGLVGYVLPASSTSSKLSGSNLMMIPCFFGLMHAGYGHLWRLVRGRIINAREDGISEVYVAPSMSEPYNGTSELEKVITVTENSGFIEKLSLDALCGWPTVAGGGTQMTFFAGMQYNSATYKGLRTTATGGTSMLNGRANLFTRTTELPLSGSSSLFTAPLCFFQEDPLIEI